MSENAEEGIARAQAAAARSKGADGLTLHHAGTVSYLNERIIVFLIAIGVCAIMVLWATAKSALVLYGSFAAVIALVLLWGYARVKRIEAVKQARTQEAQSWRASEQD